MAFLYTILLLLLAALATAQDEEEDICAPTSYRGVRLSSQEELAAITRNCKLINSTVNIFSNFTGPLVLHNITNITGSLRQYYGSAEGMTSLQLPDLEHVGGVISLYHIKPSHNLSFPRLKSIDNEIDLSFVEDGRVDFPALERPAHIDIEGNLSSVSFGALRDFAGNIHIRNSRDFNAPALTTRTDISLPVLERAGGLRISGNISSISAPQLTILEGGRPNNGSGLSYGTLSLGTLSLTLADPPIPIEFPKLASIGSSAWVAGRAESLSLPALRNVSGDLEISIYPETVGPLSFDTPLENVGEVMLRGPFESVEVPNLSNFTEFRVSSDVSLDCETLTEDLNATAGGSLRTSSRSGEQSNYRCSDESLGVSLSAGGSIGGVLGVAGVVVGMVVIGGVF